MLNSKIKIIFIATLLTACGPNSFTSLEKSDPAEDSTIALEEGNPQKAIDILTDALEGDPGNLQYISLLSMAYAQRAGVDPVTLIQNMSSTSSLAESNSITSLFSIMPPATETAIADVDTAVALLLTIPGSDRKTYDTLKLALFQTASMTLRSKILDTNGDGILSTEELMAMSSASALAMLSQIAGAVSAFADGNSTSATDKAASEQISKIQTAINAESGATDEEKLKNYLAKSSSLAATKLLRN